MVNTKPILKMVHTKTKLKVVHVMSYTTLSFFPPLPPISPISNFLLLSPSMGLLIIFLCLLFLCPSCLYPSSSLPLYISIMIE